MGFVGNLLIIPVIAMSLVYYFFGTHLTVQLTVHYEMSVIIIIIIIITVHNVRSILMICVFDF